MKLLLVSNWINKMWNCLDVYWYWNSWWK